MIEAVNAVVSNSQMLRTIAEQTSTTQVLSANPSKVQSAAIIAPYLSPHVDYSGGNGGPVFVVRDAATGETISQFPSETQIRAYTKAAEMNYQAQAQSKSQGTDGGAGESEVLKSVDFKPVRQVVKQQADVGVFKPTSTPSSYSPIAASDTYKYKAVSHVDTKA
jgi:hypothetical protein